MIPRIAILIFPGSNCEEETFRTIKRNGMSPEIVRWNEREKIAHFDGYVFVGGFSYEDRGRSGVVASKDPIMTEIKKQALLGKPILGICNGAQILVESGLVPGYSDSPELTLTWNKREKDGEIIGAGFYSSWCTLIVDDHAVPGPFTNWDKPLTIPFAHAEGRFLGEKETMALIEKNGQAVFRYVDAQGTMDVNFPTNPNGSMQNIAGISNKNGNVVAMMPHPERIEDQDMLFQSMKQWFQDQKPQMSDAPKTKNTIIDVKKLPFFDAILFVQLIITDNTEVTISRTIEKQIPNSRVTRMEFFEISGLSNEKELEQILTSGELVNLNKEIPFIKKGTDYFRYEKGGVFVPVPEFPETIVVIEHSDAKGKALTQHLHHSLQNTTLQIQHGIAWNVHSGDTSEILQTQILSNPNGANVYRV